MKDNDCILSRKWKPRNEDEKSDLYIKLGLPLMSQLQQQQSQVVQTHKAKMDVISIVNTAMITRMVTCLGRRKHIGRGRCIEVFAAVPSAWGEDKFSDYPILKISDKLKTMTAVMVTLTWKWRGWPTWQRRTTRRPQGRGRGGGWWGLGRGGFAAKKLVDVCNRI